MSKIQSVFRLHITVQAGLRDVQDVLMPRSPWKGESGPAPAILMRDGG